MTDKNTKKRHTHGDVFRKMVLAAGVLATIVAIVVVYSWIFVPAKRAFHVKCGPIFAISFSSDSRFLLAGGFTTIDRRNEACIKGWDMSSGELKWKLSDDSFSRLDDMFVTFDGGKVVSNGGPAGILLWDLKTQQVEKHVVGGDRLAINKHGNLMSTTLDKSAVVKTLPGFVELKRFDGHTDRITCISFSGDDNLLASCSWDKTVRIWDLKSGRLRSRHMLESEVLSVSFSPSCDLLVVGDSEGRLSWFETHQQDCVPFVQQFSNTQIFATTFSGEGDRIAVLGNFRVWVIDVASKRVISTIRFWQRSRAMAFSPQGDFIAVGFDDGTVGVYDVPGTSR